MTKIDNSNVSAQNQTNDRGQEKTTNHGGREGNLKPRLDMEKNVFSLEDSYPVAPDVFLPFKIDNIQKGDAIIVLDTSTLLLPYNIRQDDLTALQDVYSLLSSQKRLKIPLQLQNVNLLSR